MMKAQYHKSMKKRKRWIEHVHQVNYIPLNNDIQHSIEDMITNNKYRRATITNIIDNYCHYIAKINCKRLSLANNLHLNAI